MFEGNDEKYLTRLIGRNEVILFLGSGFSRDAKNLNKENFPTGYQLGEKIWDFIGYQGSYDKSLLPEMYQSFLLSSRKKQEKIDFLNSNLLSGEIPDIYNSISIPYWYKIYSLNIDDIVSKVYKRNGKIIKEAIYPKDEYIDKKFEFAVLGYDHSFPIYLKKNKKI